MNQSPSKSLLSIEGMTKHELEEILELTDTFDEIGRRPIPKVPAPVSYTHLTLPTIVSV